MTCAADVRALAMALPEVEEAPHFESASFRVRGKILATLAAETCTLKLPREIQESLCQSDPAAIELPTHWSKFGWTTITLAGFDTERLADLIASSWRQVAPKTLLKGDGA